MSWSGGASLHSLVFDYGGVLNPDHTTIYLCTVRGFILTPRVVALFVTVNRCVGRLAPLFVLNSFVHGSREPIAVLSTAGFNTAPPHVGVCGCNVSKFLNAFTTTIGVRWDVFTFEST